MSKNSKFFWSDKVKADIVNFLNNKKELEHLVDFSDTMLNFEVVYLLACFLSIVF